MDTNTHVITASATGSAASAAASLVADLQRDLHGEAPALVMVFASALADADKTTFLAGDMSGFHNTTSVVPAFPR